MPRGGPPGYHPRVLPLAIVMNARSGHLDAHARIETVRRVMAADGRAHTLITIDDPRGLGGAIRRAIDWATPRSGAVVVAGGDGTLNAAAKAVIPAGLAFGVLPQGTFNYFARTHGVASDTESALHALLRASPSPVQVGRVNGQVFLVNASLGLYPELLADREWFKRRLGRYRFNAAIAAVWTILRKRRRWTLDLELGDRHERVSAITLFVGNNRLQLEEVGAARARAPAQGRLAGILVHPMSRWALLSLAVRGALGALADDPNTREFAFRKLTVTPARGGARRGVKIGVDGEVLRLVPPIVFDVSPEPLRLLLPPATAVDALDGLARAETNAAEAAADPASRAPTDATAGGG